jgi:hypothetical protein
MPGRREDEGLPLQIQDAGDRGRVRIARLRANGAIGDLEHDARIGDDGCGRLHRLANFAHRHGRFEPVA